MDFEENLRRLEPLLGKDKVLRLWRTYQQEDGTGRRELEAMVQLQLEKRLGIDPLSQDHCLAVPSKSESSGDFVLGEVVTGNQPVHPFGLRADEFIQHTAIFGRSGAGKTNTVALLIRELVRNGKPFVIFDWKRNYRDLLEGPDPVPLEVYTVGRRVRPLHFNPLIPPRGTDIKIWLKKLIEIISHAYYLGEGVMFLLQEAFDHVYQAHGCYEDPAMAQYPTMQDVLDHLEGLQLKGRKAMWLDSTMRAVQSLCFGQISDVINVSQNDSIESLLGQNACLELNALANAEKVFLIETLMVWIHHLRMQETKRETFKHCIIIEEAHNILSPAGKETVIDTLLREVRELGEAIVLVDQHPSQISIPALGNTYCTIALNLKHSKDINALADIMQVPREQRELFGTLAMGRGIVKLQSRFVHPFQIQIPKLDIAKGAVEDHHLASRFSRDGDSAGSSPDTEESDDTGGIPADRKEKPEPAKTRLPPTEEALLKDIKDHPLDGVVRRYNRLGLSRRRGNRAKESLIKLGIIEPVDVPTKTGKVVLLDFTDEMKEVLKRNGVPLRNARHGGLIHAYWVDQLRKTLNTAGWKTTTEAPIGAGMAIDLLAEKNGQKLAVEIETGRRGTDNIAKLITKGIDWILSFSINDQVEETTKRALKRHNIHLNNLIFAKPNNYEGKIQKI
jgi:hypothetical protein